MAFILLKIFVMGLRPNICLCHACIEYRLSKTDSGKEKARKTWSGSYFDKR
jgi:hypothetical protein